MSNRKEMVTITVDGSNSTIMVPSVKYLRCGSPEYISRHVRRLENIEQHGAVKIPDTISTPEEFYQWILQTSKANR